MRIEPKLFFLKLFGRFRDIPAKSRDIPPKKFDFLGFEAHIELFGPPPLHVEDPHPTRGYPDPKSLGLGSFFFPEKCPESHFLVTFKFSEFRGF